MYQAAALLLWIVSRIIFEMIEAARTHGGDG